MTLSHEHFNIPNIVQEADTHFVQHAASILLNVNVFSIHHDDPTKTGPVSEATVPLSIYPHDPLYTASVVSTLTPRARVLSYQ